MSQPDDPSLTADNGDRLANAIQQALEDHYGTWRADGDPEWAAKAFAAINWREQVSVREAIRSELIRQHHLAGECGGADA